MASAGDSPGGESSEKDDDVSDQALEGTSEIISPWTHLPHPVFSQLISKMSAHFVHIARQVCSSWLTHVDNHIGLKVKVDTSLAGNLDFFQSVKVVEARVVNWQFPSTDDDTAVPEAFRVDSFFQFPSCLRKLTLSGKLPEEWKTVHLKEFPNLEHLVLRGSALFAQDMTGSALPPLSAAGSDSDDYEGYLPVAGPTIVLKRLKSLEIIMNEFSYPPSLPLNVRFHDIERSREHERYLHRLYLVVVNNVGFILNHVASPVLSTLHIYVYPKAGIIAPSNLNWKFRPLQTFLKTHKRTLRQLYLPDLEGTLDMTTVAGQPEFPTRLTKVQLLLSQFIGDREENREQDSTYWSRALMEQCSLSELDLTILDMPGVWIETTLSTLAFSCKDTLNFIDLVIQAEEPVQLNLEVFAFCQNLEVLKISAGREHDTVVNNIGKLPPTLKKLRVNMSLVEMPDPELIGKFKKLEMLELVTIMVADPSHVRTLPTIRKLMELRNLNLLSLTFDVAGNSSAELMQIFQILDDDYEPRFGNFYLRVNPSYEFESGWGEDRFDEQKNDLEYINTREPEEYRTWHRNAISVDDEDHRVFMLQTLSFLQHMRRESRDDDDDDIPDQNDSDDDDGTDSRFTFDDNMSESDHYDDVD